MYEMMESRKVDEKNDKYIITKAGVAGAHSKKSPKKIFTKKASDESKEGYVDFEERKRKLKKNKVIVKWGNPPEKEAIE